jgi:hypothetical protein
VGELLPCDSLKKDILLGCREGKDLGPAAPVQRADFGIRHRNWMLDCWVISYSRAVLSLDDAVRRRLEISSIRSPSKQSREVKWGEVCGRSPGRPKSIQNNHGNGKRSQLNSGHLDSKHKQANNAGNLDFSAQSGNATTRASDLSRDQQTRRSARSANAATCGRDLVTNVAYPQFRPSLRWPVEPMHRSAAGDIRTQLFQHRSGIGEQKSNDRSVQRCTPQE